MSINTWFGIDFGTTNSSAIGIIDTGAGQSTFRFGDDYGGPLPSLVAVDRETGEVFCGRSAWEKRRELSGKCEVIHSIKSELGTKKVWLVNGVEWTPELVAAEILKGLKKQVYQKQNFDLNEAVISVPVGFAPPKRRALRRAASLAGIKVISFVSESTSAFFKNYNKIKHFSKVAVFDWGGGTLDISIIENKNGRIFERSTSSLKCGGDDIDLKLAKLVHSKFVREKNIKKSFDEMDARFQDMLIVKAERAKRELSESDSVNLSVNNYGEFGAIRAAIDIDVFSLLIEPEVNTALKTLEQAVKKANISMAEIECIIMVGGSSNLRPLVEKIGNKWGGPQILYPENAVWNVAEGAALLCMNPGKIKLNHDIGLVLADNSFFPICKKDDEVPVDAGKFEFGAVEDTRNAVFAFSDNTYSDNGMMKILNYENIPVFGFFNEVVLCRAVVDDNYVFRIKMKSNHKQDKDARLFEYSDLNFYYELPGVGNDDE